MASGGEDFLSEFLKPLRLTGVFDSRWHLSAPWAIEGDAEERCAVLHYMVAGSCWISREDHPPLQLRAGDLALFPTGAAHRLSDHPDRRGTVPLRAVLPERRPGTSGEIRMHGPRPESRLLCAGLHYDASAATALYKALPWVLVLDSTQVGREPLLRSALEVLASPDHSAEPGDRLVTLRAFEMTLVLALRPMLRELSKNPDALPALRHPGIGRALLIMSTRFPEPWTNESLAREVGMSRSAFTAAFRELVGEAPARYLTGRRMQEAARLLEETSLPQAAVPERVGYLSAVGFHLAFRKWFGVTPGEFRNGSELKAG